MGEITASHTDLSLTLRTIPTDVIDYNWGNREGTPVLLQKPSDDTFLRTIQHKSHRNSVLPLDKWALDKLEESLESNPYAILVFSC